MCAELMRRCIEATSAHLQARADASETAEADAHADLDEQAERIIRLRDAKATAMHEYQEHMLAHRSFTANSAGV